MIAGEGLVGILLAILAVAGVADVIDLTKMFQLPEAVLSIGSIVLFGIIILTLLKFTIWKKAKKDSN